MKKGDVAAAVAMMNGQLHTWCMVHNNGSLIVKMIDYDRNVVGAIIEQSSQH